MDARNTGALIAQRRKALGMTQKQLAERLLISDKAVSKWENGASYPEVTLLPPLAQILGITVDELLAGAVREDGQSQEAEQTDAADTPNEQAAAPPLDGHLAPQDYLADRLGSVDDKMLLAAVVLILTAAYCGSLFGQAAVLRNLVVILVVYVAFRVWHNKQCDRFSVLGVDTTVSRRRVCMADRLFGIVWVFELLVWWLLKRLSWLLLDYEAAKIGRYYVMYSAGDVNINSHQPWLLLYAVAAVPLFLVMVAMFSLAYRRMDAETRFRPLAVVLPVLPCLMGTGAIGYLRAQAALANMPDYGVPLATVNERNAFEQSLLHAGQDALNGAAIVIAVLVVVLLVLWRVTHGRVPFASTVMLGVYAVIWLPSNALWLDIGYEQFIEAGGTENMTIQLGGLVTLIMATALCAGIALFADSLRRKKG
ncbi:helix-turn-helix transcriptional regulator [uncultured Agathobaculum sp.]|uniref:helix-turn-helix domain-containing protein n=1 Tax=uncultured Agathobaculum sp. TaxID=2048140 RepID=UPI00320B98EF